MTDLLIDEQAAGAAHLPVRVGLRDLVIAIQPGHTIAHILAVIAIREGLVVEDLYLVRDGCDEPLGHDHPVHGGDHHHRHHVHHRGPITVTVHYQNTSHHHQFKRHASLERVLDWAIGKFGIDPSMAGEFELALKGSTEELPLSEHVGHLAGKHNTLELNLVRGDIANGACRD